MLQLHVRYSTPSTPSWWRVYSFWFACPSPCPSTPAYLWQSWYPCPAMHVLLSVLILLFCYFVLLTLFYYFVPLPFFYTVLTASLVLLILSWYLCPFLFLSCYPNNLDLLFPGFYPCPTAFCVLISLHYCPNTFVLLPMSYFSFELVATYLPLPFISY